MIATFTFDPEKVMTITEIAKIVGVSHQAAGRYVQRHGVELPPPMFRLRFEGKGIDVWSRRDGLALCEEYAARRAER